MQKLTLLLLLLTSLSANAMYHVAKSVARYQQFQSSLPARQVSGVTAYQPHHEKALKKIALDNIYHLTTWYMATRKNEHEGLVEGQVMSLLRSEQTNLNKKVFLENGKPVGFITYSVYEPWYNRFLRLNLGPKATLLHLAVDENFRAKGYGAALVKAALADCKSKSVSYIKLWANTDEDLDRFYKKMGFREGYTTKLRETHYSLRLRPHPVARLIKALNEKLKAKPHDFTGMDNDAVNK